MQRLPAPILTDLPAWGNALADAVRQGAREHCDDWEQALVVGAVPAEGLHGVAPGRVHCGAGRLVGPNVATPSASERQYQHEPRPSGQPSGLSSHASPRP